MNIALLLKIQTNNDDLTDEEILILSSKEYIKRLLALGKENILIKILQKNFILENGVLFKSKVSDENSNNITLEELFESAIKGQKIKIITYLLSIKNELDKQILTDSLYKSLEIVVDNNDIDCLRLLLDELSTIDTKRRELALILKKAISSNCHEMVDLIIKTCGDSPDLFFYYIKRYSESIEIEPFNAILSKVLEKNTIKYLFTNILDDYIKQGNICLSDFISSEHNNYHNELYQYCTQQASRNKYYAIIKSLMDKGADFNEYLLFYAAKNNQETCINKILNNRLITARLTIENAANMAFASGNTLIFYRLSNAVNAIILPDEEAVISAAQACHYNAIDELIQMHENKQISDEYASNIFDTLNNNFLNRSFLINIAIAGNFALLNKLIDTYKLKIEDYMEEILNNAIKNNRENFVLSILDKFPLNKEHAFTLAAVHNKIDLIKKLEDKFGKLDIRGHFNKIWPDILNCTHDIDDKIIDFLFPIDAVKNDIYGHKRTFIWFNLLKSNNLKLLYKLTQRQYPLYIDISLYDELSPSVEAVKLLISHHNYPESDKSEWIDHAISNGNYDMYEMLLQEIQLDALPADIRKKIEMITQHAKQWGITEREYIEFNSAEPHIKKQIWEKIFGKDPRTEIAFIITSSPSPYGFNIKLYYEILPFLKTAMGLEGATDNHAIVAAYKLCVLFENKQQVMTYLENHIKRHPYADAPISDACYFYLPSNGIWDIKSWRQLVKMHGKQIAKFLHFAPLIENELNKQDVSINVILTHIEKEIYDSEKEVIDKANKNEINNKMQQYDKWLITYVEQISKSDRYKSTPMSEKEKKEMLEKLRKQKLADLTLSTELNTQKEIQKKARIKLNKLLQKNDNISCLPEQSRREAARKEIDNRNLLSLTPQKLQELAAKVAYSNIDHNLPDFAHLCAINGILRNDFVAICAYFKKSKEIRDILPELLIDGTDIDEPDYYFIKIAKDDPRGYILGELTNCCQSYGGNAHACVMHGTTSPYAGFYAVMKKGPGGKIDIYKDKIVAQSYAWITEKGNLAFDSEESLQPELGKRWLKSFYTHAAKQAIGHRFDLNIIPIEQQNDEHYKKLKSLGVSPEIKEVFLGKGGGTPEDLDLIPMLPAEKPLSGEWLYNDAANQYILSMEPIPRLQVKL